MVFNRTLKSHLFSVRIAILAITLPCSVCMAQESGDTGTVAGKTAGAKKECRTSRTTGSKMRRSICLTREEWAEIDAQSREAESEQEKDKDAFFRKAIQRGGLGTGDIMDNPNSR